MTAWLLEILYPLAGAILGGALVSWQTYARKKGENLATKEDIGEITDRIEAVKAVHRDEFERTRAEIQASLHERQTRFSRWHDRQAAVLGGLYKRLARVEMAFLRLPNAAPDDEGVFEELLAEAGKARQKCFTYFTENELYIDAAIVSHIVELDQLTTEARVALELRQQQRGMLPGGSDKKTWQRSRGRAVRSTRASQSCVTRFD